MKFTDNTTLNKRVVFWNHKLSRPIRNREFELSLLRIVENYLLEGF